MRQIIADYDGAGIYVYQAFKPAIVESALRCGTFADGFKLDRMTWIKPSFGWMLYRSGYAAKENQERILRIKITHVGFLDILRCAVPTAFDPRIFESQEAWEFALSRSTVRYQWDPDRDWRLRRVGRRAIQLGIKGATVRQYVNDWIVELEDVTGLARACKAGRDRGAERPTGWPDERVYPVSAELRGRLGMF